MQFNYNFALGTPFFDGITSIFSMKVHSMHNPPCESPWAELAHGVIEWSAGVYADRGALMGGKFS